MAEGVRILSMNDNGDAFAGDDAYTLLPGNDGGGVLFLCDHASKRIPPEYGTLGLDEAMLWRHIAWDIGAADVTRRLAAMFGAPALFGGYSRLLADLNRFMDDPSVMPVISDGVEIPANKGIDAAERERRRRAYYAPYHDAVDARLSAMEETGVVPAVFSIHSFTPIMNGFERPWHVGILWGEDGRLARPMLEALGRNPALTVGDNQPYSAREPYGYTTEHHCVSRGLPHVVVEIRQDLIDTHHGAEEWANILADVIRHTLAAGRPFSRQFFTRQAS